MASTKGKKRGMENALELYDQGKWDKSIERYGEIREVFGEARDIDAMEGWVWWKKRNIKAAVKLWRRALDLTKAPDITNSTAMSGLGLAMAEEKNPIAVKYVEMGIAMLPKGDEDIDTSIRLNTCTIAVAKLGYHEKAEEIIRRAIEINERFEQSDNPEIARRGKHQRAKNGYNLCSLVLIPTGRTDEARGELVDEVIPRYQQVNAPSDEAAAVFRIGLIHEKGGKYEYAEDWYKRSKELWETIGDPKRIQEAQANIDRARGLLEKQQELDTEDINVSLSRGKNL